MVLCSIAPSETENDEPKPWIPGEAWLNKKKNEKEEVQEKKGKKT